MQTLRAVETIHLIREWSKATVGSNQVRTRNPSGTYCFTEAVDFSTLSSRHPRHFRHILRDRLLMQTRLFKSYVFYHKLFKLTRIRRVRVFWHSRSGPSNLWCPTLLLLIGVPRTLRYLDRFRTLTLRSSGLFERNKSFYKYNRLNTLAALHICIKLFCLWRTTLTLQRLSTSECLLSATPSIALSGASSVSWLKWPKAQFRCNHLSRDITPYKRKKRQLFT